MNKNRIKSGREIVDDFFDDISTIKGVDTAIADSLAELYYQDKLTDKNVANKLQKLRQHNGN